MNRISPIFVSTMFFMAFSLVVFWMLRPLPESPETVGDSTGQLRDRLNPASQASDSEQNH